MPRLYLPSINPIDGRFRLSGEHARYLGTVLRTAEGDRFEVFDAQGQRFMAQVLSVQRNAIEARVLEPLPPAVEPATPVVLLVGILKGAKMDMVIQKAVELGVHRVVPAVCSRSVVRRTRKPERWRKISLEAARQSGRTHVPEVAEPVDFLKYLSSAPELCGYIFWEDGGVPLRSESRPEPAGELTLAIGPEGGFTPEEVRTAEAHGLIAATLGPRILRAETAALASLTLVQHMLGEI